MKEIVIDTDRLVALIKKHTVSISFNGFIGFKHDVVNARKLLDEIHDVADCDKDVLVDYTKCRYHSDKWMDKEKYKPNAMIDILFNNIERQGVFLVAGCEDLGNDPYIEIKRIKDVIPIKD
jgi:hypothetical protein